MRNISFVAIIFLLTFPFYGSAQSSGVMADTSQYPYWIEMMQDPGINFFQTQSAFQKYWQDRPVTRGSGWKPFKRWESYMKDRVSVTGEIPSPDHVMKEYANYMGNRKSTNSTSGNWISQGPFDLPMDKGYKGLGRINTIAFHPTDPNIIYIGAPAGGLWVTTVGGNNWSTTTDMLPTLGVSAIVVDPHDPSVIYIGTGDRDAGDAPGVGVMKSTDGGTTWSMANNTMGNVTVGDMLIDPDNTQIVYAGTTGGLFKSIDGGVTWERKATGQFKDIAFKPGNNQVIYGTYSGKFARSIDAGENWTTISNGIATGPRGVIAVTPANPEVVYFMQSKGDNSFRGLYKSTDSGLTFTEMSSGPNIFDWSCDGSGTGGQAWYDMALVADPVNTNIVYAGGVDIWKSTNGGATWQINGHWYGGCGAPAVHADQHYFTYNPLNNRIYAGNDGGIYWTANGGLNWNEISTGLAISQAYKLGQSATVDDIVVNGYQDNGTSIYESGTWTAIGGGDGMECAIDHTDASYRYTTVYYGVINRCVGNYNQGSIAGQGVNGITESGNWVTPFIIDENDPNTMFIGYSNIWRSENIKAGNLGSVKWDKISAINTANLDVLEQSPKNTNILYASATGNLYISTNVKDENPEWLNITGYLPSTGSIYDIECHPFDENTVYIIQGNNVFKSTDQARNWTDITSSLPDIHYSTLAYYKNSQEGLYLGSDAGVFYKDQSMTDWIPFENGLPANARITELEIYYDPASPAGDRIKASTYGRGMWKSDMYFNIPAAEFTADKLIIPFGCDVSFTDLSTGIPFEWHWSFPGGTPSSSDAKNPSGIFYNAAGVYDVQLIAVNPSGSDTIVKTAYITASDTILPVTDFDADPRVYCYDNQVVKFIDKSGYCPFAWHWVFEPNNVVFQNGTSDVSQNPEVIFTQKGEYSVTLTALNSNGSSTLYRQNFILAGGYPLPFSEDFESGSLTTRLWTVKNPDQLVTWDIADIGGNTPGTKAAWMNFYDYAAPAGQRDKMITAPLDFTNTDPVFLTFEHAYATRFSTSSDSLIIYLSADCGQSWQRIFEAGEKGAGTFATVPKQLTPFTPAVYDDWCGNGWGSACYIIDLSDWANMPGIQLAFESYSKHSNNLFIDNITISSTTGLTEIPADGKDITVYPNPTTGVLMLTSHIPTGLYHVTIYNQQGVPVFDDASRSLSNLSTTIDLSGQPKGIYLMRIATDRQTKFEKIVLR